MKMIKQWFDVHDTVYNGSDNKKPISDENDHRLLWLEKDFTCYVRNIQEVSIASGKGEFTDETYQALLFTTKATVETTRLLLGRGMKYVLTRNFNSDPVEALFGRLRSMCGGNDVLDARAVTIALDNIVKGKAIPLKQMQATDTHAEELASAVPQEVIAQLENLKGHFLNPSPSVTYSGLVYVGGYLVKLISEFGCDACVMMVTMTNKGDPFFTLLDEQNKSGLHYPNRMFLALLDSIVAFFEAASKHLPRTKVHEVLQLLVAPYLEQSPILDCPEDVGNGHQRSTTNVIAEKFVRLLLVNYIKMVTEKNDKPVQLLMCISHPENILGFNVHNEKVVGTKMYKSSLY